MEVVPVSVGLASRAWDEQHLELTAAADQVREAPTGGFTRAVSGAAQRFASAWERHADGLAQESEARADGLRTALRDYVTSDQTVGAELYELLAYLPELR